MSPTKLCLIIRTFTLCGQVLNLWTFFRHLAQKFLDIRIIAIGLDYTIYLSDGTVLEVNAEEEPGKIYDSSLVIND